MEHPEESDQLPEEGPAEQVPDDDGDRGEKRHDSDSSPGAPHEGRQEGGSTEQSTGNPHSAG
jgi:hypothetical protein